ncbi:MAG TPA: prolyl oligopeptidase family serine peptidase [Thermoanaerobaculia bacterium]|nr:prolyl oligopeptidase family serine peptidase [Thermoanaerobaculia bacterium]
MPPIPFALAGPRPLVGQLDLPEAPAPAPVVVMCSGFKGFADWAFFPPLAALLAERGLAAVRFNFGGSGMRLGEDRVSNLEAFRRQTISGEVADLQVLLAALPELAPGRLDSGRLALFGHSRGGAVALLVAASPAQRERLRALVTWSAVSHFDRMSDHEVARWRTTGTWRVVNARTGQELPVGLDLLHDVERHGGELDPRAAAARRRAPWLLVHGERDETVPLAEGEELAAAAVPPAELLRVAGADHAFGTRHPFAGPNPALITAMNATQTWLLRHLRAQ